MRKLILISAVLTVALAGPIAPAPAAKKNRCAGFTGKLLFQNTEMRVVRQKRSHGNRIVACDRRTGKGRLLGVNRKTTHSSVATVLLVGKSHFIAIRESRSNGFTGAVSTRVIDVRTGDYYNVATWTYSDAISPGGGGTATIARSLRLTSDGRSAAVVAIGKNTPSFDQTSTAVLAYNVTTTLRLLDSGPRGSIPAVSLRIAGGVVNWTKLGVSHSAAL